MAKQGLPYGIIAAVYFDDGADDVRRQVAQRMTKEQARVVAERIVGMAAGPS